MAIHDTPKNPSSCVTLPGVVPFDLSHLTRLSWELGSRSVGDSESTLHSEWGHENHWKLSIFRSTSETSIIRVTTPVGREQFYGAAQMDLSAAVPKLHSAPRWQKME